MIRLKDLSLSLGKFRLQSVNLEIEQGEYFAILGPTGAGKTKLLEIIAGLERPASGEVWLDGKNVTNLPPERRRIGFVYQDYLLFPHLTVRKNITFGLRRLTGSDAESRLSEIASLLKIGDLLDRGVAGLSGGEQQRIALARALVTRPQALLLDEPLSALDPQTRRNVRRELGLLHKQLGTTTIHVTHDIEEALVLADRIAVINYGAIVQVGPPAEVLRQPTSPFVAQFVGLENLFKGEIVFSDSNGSDAAPIRNAVFQSGSIGLRVISGSEGSAYASVRPEDISLSVEQPHSSALNNLRGKVIEIDKRGPLVRLTVDAGLPFVVLLTSQSLSALELRQGSEVYLSFKASAVHIF